MDVRPIDRATFEAFVAGYTGPQTFLQSPTYADFRTAVGEESSLYGLYSDSKLEGVFSQQIIRARRGTYCLIPHGPLLTASDAKTKIRALEAIKAHARTLDVHFVRVSPLWAKVDEKLLSQAGYRPSPPYMVNPERTITLDLGLSDEELLAQMKKSTRYEVRRIEKAGITVTQGNSEKDLETFWQLHTTTVGRQGFTPFPRSHTQAELAAFGDDAQIFTAWIDDTPLSSSLILFTGTEGAYHQGSSVRSKFPVAHATLWAAMQAARARGCARFNLWGVSEADNKAHPWYGLSKFKRGFGGTETEYAHAHDAPLRPWYAVTWAIETYERKKRGY